MVNKKRKIEVKDLNEHLSCSLCNGYLIDATTITECLHTFCRSCIRRQLSIKPNCPTCEKNDPNLCPKSSPKLRHDRTLQSLVYKIVPGLYQRELSCRRKFIQTHSGQDDRIVRWSDEVPRDKKALTSPGFSKDEIFSICLKRQTNNLGRIGNATSDIQSFLACPGHVSVGALKKFVLMKLGLLKDWQVIFFNNLESFADGCTLVDVAYIKRWDKLSPLVLDYYLINPHVNGLQLTRSTKKRPRTVEPSMEGPSVGNNSVRITESSPTSGIKIRIRLSESIRQERHSTRNEESRRNSEDGPASSLPGVEIKQEMMSPQKNSEERMNKIDEEDFEPPQKRGRVDGEAINPNQTSGLNNNNNGVNANKNSIPVEKSSSDALKKKRGRPKKTGSTYGKLSILSLLKRRWSQEPQIKKELPTSPEKDSEEATSLLKEEGRQESLGPSEFEPIGDGLCGLSNGGNASGADGNTSIVTFREDNQEASHQTSPQKVISKPCTPVNVATSCLETSANGLGTADVQVNSLGLSSQVDDVSKGAKNGVFGHIDAQPKCPDISVLSQSADLQRLLLLAQQPNLFVPNAEILAAYNQKLCELIASQNPCPPKLLEGILSFQQQQQPTVQLGGNLVEGTANINGEMFAPAKLPQVPPDYLSSILLGQQVPQMLLSYPQLPLQSLVLPQGYECGLVQNVLAPNQKSNLETAPLTADQMSSLTVPLPYNFVYPSVPPQYLPDCANYYMGQALQQAGNPFDFFPKSNYQEIPQSYEDNKTMRNKSFLSDEGMQRAASIDYLTNQAEIVNGCTERPLFSPMSVDEDDKRAGLIPESALDPSKEIGAEKCDSLLNGSHTSDVSV